MPDAVVPTPWQATHSYVLGDLIVPTVFDPLTGVAFECTHAGTSGGSEPTWPTNGSVADGGVTWTAMVVDQAVIATVYRRTLLATALSA